MFLLDFLFNQPQICSTLNLHNKDVFRNEELLGVVTLFLNTFHIWEYTTIIYVGILLSISLIFLTLGTYSNS